MTAGERSVPEGAQTLTAHLSVNDAIKAIDFYQRAFGAEPLFVHKSPNGTVMHATLKIGDSRLMLADEVPGRGFPAPTTLGGSSVVLNILVDDVHALWKRAVDAGAKVTLALADQFWGDRYGKLLDPYGHEWSVATHLEDVSPAEMRKRQEVAMAQMAQGPPPGNPT